MYDGYIDSRGSYILFHTDYRCKYMSRTETLVHTETMSINLSLNPYSFLKSGPSQNHIKHLFKLFDSN